MAQNTVRGPVAVLDLGDQGRPDPDHALALFLGRQRDRRAPRAQRLEPGVQALHLSHGKPGADPADVAQPAVLGLGEEQRADPARGLRRIVADDREILALAAFDLEPAPGPGLLIGRVGALADHPFEAEPRGLLEKRPAVALDVLAELKRRGRRDDRSEQRAERPLALVQRHAREIVAVEVEQIEGEAGELVSPAFGERVLKGGEARDPVRVLDHDLAVDQRVLTGERRERLGEQPVAVGPVLAGPGQQADRAGLEARERPVAVELDLVQPLVAFGHARARGRELGPHGLRQRRLERARQRRWPEPPGLARGGRRRPARRLGREQLLDPAAAQHALRPLIKQLVAVTRARVRVALFDQEPVVAALAVLGLEPDQHPAAAELFAHQPELEGALPVFGLRVADRDPAAPVPDDHGAGAVLALGDRLLEVGVFQRMVLDVHGQAPDLGVERWPLGHRPAPQCVAELQPQVIMQAPRGVLLDHEQAGPGRDLTARRLRRLRKIALRPIALERSRCPAFGHCHPRPRTLRRPV